MIADSKRRYGALHLACIVIASVLALAVATILLSKLVDSSRYYPVHEHGAVLVTGTHSGLGLLVTQLLASHGYDVLATVRKSEQLQMWAGTPRVHPIVLEDVGDLASVERTFEEVRT